MIEVSVENFELEVMQASVDTPVLVDFWAPWCAPCKVIGPLLEQLEEDYQGRFKLVKINSDDEQQISQAFGIKSLPTCILLKQGRPVDGFMGALPLGQIKAFLDKHLPSVEELTALEGPRGPGFDGGRRRPSGIGETARGLGHQPGQRRCAF